MSLIIAWKNNPPWRLEIDPNKTILDLKKKISEHYNGTNIGFCFSSGNKIIDNSNNSKSLTQCHIDRIIRLPDDYDPKVSSMKLSIIWKNLEPWELEIEPNKTIFDLKKAISNHYKNNNTGFYLLNGNDIYDSKFDSKTLVQCGIGKIIRIQCYNEPSTPLKSIIVVWKNQNPWKLEIDENQTISELKKKIAEHYNLEYNSFNILNGNKIFDSTSDNKTILECGIKRIIRLPDSCVPGT